MFKKIKLFNLVLIVLVGLMFINLNEMKAFSGSATLSLDGVNVTVLESNVDPITVKGGETTVGNLVVVEFTHNQASGNDVLMYTTKWPFKSTDVRPGAYEYAFSKEGSDFVLTEKSIGGNLEIPFNGFVISSKQDIWGNVQTGAKLSSTLDIPTYAGAIEIEGTGEYAGETRRDIRIAIDNKNKKRNVYETIYYNNEWGTETGQNEFGVEIKVTLTSSGEFRISDIRDLRDTEQLQIGSKDFVVSIHGDKDSLLDYRVLLGNNHFSKLNDKVSLIGMPFVELSKSETSTITVVDPTGPVNPNDKDELNDYKYYPGFRSYNYLMMYTKDYVKSTDPLANNFPNYTGCNEWGYELVVEITEQEGSTIKGLVYDSATQIDSLPGDNYVILSGNGKGADFLTQNCLKGADVIIDLNTKEVTISSTLQSYISTVENRYALVNEMMSSAINAKYKLNYIGEGDTKEDNKWTRLQKSVEGLLGAKEANNKTSMYGIKNLFENFDGSETDRNVLTAEFNNMYLTALNECNKIECLSYSSPAISSIGVWHRPNNQTERDLAGVLKTLEIFKTANVNTVYLETFWNGYSMSIDSKYVDHHINFQGTSYEGYKDYLDCFITEAHKLGIEVHAWVEDFYVGYEGFTESNVLNGQKPNSDEFLEDRSSWVMRDYQGNDYTQFEGGKYKFIDPSNPAVRSFLINYYKELMTNYEFDGINLDYIRYPVQNGYTGNEPYDYGYNDYAAKKFLAEQGYAESEQTLAKLRSELNMEGKFASLVKEFKAKWDAFKVRQITEYVGEVHQMITGLEEELEKEIIISTAVFAGTDALEKKSQDWESWVQAGYIEVTTPMAYYPLTDRVTKELQGMINKISGVAYNYAGIAAYFQGLEPIEEVYHVLASAKGNAMGTVIFDSKTIINSKEALEFLSNGVSSYKPIIPHTEINALLKAFRDEMKSRKELYEITSANSSLYDKMFDDLANMETGTINQMAKVLKAILTMQEDSELVASGHAITRINDELENLYEVVSVRYERMKKGWVEAETEPADKSKLVASINSALGLESGKYTEESWSALQEALTAASTVNEKADATQEEVDSALSALDGAIKALSTLTPEPGVEPSGCSGCNGFVLPILAGLGLVVFFFRRRNF